ncbi:MAG: hypothetical protein L3J79_07655 [Candidatus Marinimicrobia bacterium]|nr:hypothetical protein [Candidatus Neomarinimicrobiota bacterium]
MTKIFRPKMAQLPIQVAVNFGVSYWAGLTTEAFVGYHPAIFAGNDKLFVVGQYNYIRSRYDMLMTQDLLLGRPIKQKDSRYTLTPYVGLHRSEEALDNVFYLLGVGFIRPLVDFDIRV